jgi:polyisoprenoid-binding protein YceI
MALAQAANRDPAKVEAGTYTLDPDHTQVEFGVMHLGFTPYYGRFSDASGKLVLSPHNPAESKLEVTIPAASISTTSDKLTGELKGADWLDAQKFPDITFRSTQVTPSGAGTAKVTGNLTLHGVTRPVTLDVKLVGSGTNPLDKHYTVGFSATGQISRSEFGVTKYVPLIGDELKLTLSGAFEQQS